jgi:hypothetical protein
MAPWTSRVRALDHNRHGTAYGLTVYSAIRTGQEETVRALIEAIPKGQQSPLAALDGLHFSRLHIFDELVYQGGGQKPDTLNHAYLVFTASFNGDPEPFLDEICEKVGAAADAWWEHCYAYPGTADRGAFKRWIATNQIHSALFASPYPNESVQAVRSALALRERVLAFAIDAQGLDAAALKARFDETFAEAR